MLYFISFTALQIRAGHRSITANLWPLTAHIYHIMIIVTGGFSKKSFFAIIFWSSRTQIFFKTGAIRNFAKCTGKHLCWSLFLIKLQAGLQLYFNLVPKETWTQVIPVKIAKFLRAAFSFWNTSGGCFCQFDNLTVQCRVSADLLFLIKNKMHGMVSTNKVCRSGQSILFTH